MKTCPYCGEQMDVFSPTCPYCQADLRSAPAAKQRGSSGQPRISGSQRWIIVSVVLFLLLYLALPGPVLWMPLSSLLTPRYSRSIRPSCRNNLKQIGLALHNYHDTFGSFSPAYVADKNGRPLYSWRVLILPYIDQAPMYNEFDLTQPWDSPTNLRLLDKMPDIFRCPSDTDAADNTTSYVAVFGPNCVFTGAKPISISDLTDGTSNTIMVGEVTGTAIPWTKPEDIDITAQPTIGIPGGLSSRHVGGCQFLFGDGRVKFVSENIAPQTLHDLFIRNDGHKVGEY